MRINDTTIINGIFNYDPSVEYTKGDMVIYNKLLYRVLEDTNNESKTPNENQKFEEYFKSNIARNLEDGSKLVTANMVKTYINSMITGLNYGGTVTRKAANDLDLNNIAKSTSASVIYSVYFPDNQVPSGKGYPTMSLSLTVPSECIFKSFRFYKSNIAYVLQELTDFTNGGYYTRFIKFTNNTEMDISEWNKYTPIDTSFVSSELQKLEEVNQSIDLCGMIDLNLSGTNVTIKKSTLTDLKLKYLDIEVTYMLSGAFQPIQDIVRVSATNTPTPTQSEPVPPSWKVNDNLDYKLVEDYVEVDNSPAIMFSVLMNETPLSVNQVTRVIGVKYLT